MRISAFSRVFWAALVCGGVIDVAAHSGLHAVSVPVPSLERVGHLVTFVGMLGIVVDLCIERAGAWRRRSSSGRPPWTVQRVIHSTRTITGRDT